MDSLILRPGSVESVKFIFYFFRKIDVFCNEIYRFAARIKSLFETGAFRIFLEGYIRRWILQENRGRRIQTIGGFTSIAIVGKRDFIRTATVITAWEKALETGETVRKLLCQTLK